LSHSSNAATISPLALNRSTHARGLPTVGVAVTYALLALLLTWPLIARLGVQIPAGAGGDVWVHEWTFWWIERAIAAGQNPFYTDLLFHPHGVSLTTHNIAWFNIGLWYPLQAAFGDAAAYSLSYILLFMLNAFAMYLLALEWTGSRAAAIIGGLIFGFWPYLTSQSGHPNMLTVSWLPLALIYVNRTLTYRGRRNAVLAGLFVALQGIARWQLLIVGGLLLAIFVIYRALTDHRTRTWHTVGRLALIGLVALVCMAPLATPVVAAQWTRTDTDDVLIDDSEFGVDLLAYVLPNANLALWSNLVERLPPRLQFRHDRVDFVGYTVLALCLIGIGTQRRRVGIWLILALLLGGLALGSVLTVGHRIYPQISLPHGWIDDLFFIRLVRRPHRFHAFLGVPVAMLASLGVLTLLRWRLLASRRVLLIGLLVVLIAAEYWVLPYRMTTLETPAWYRQLARDPDRFGILGLPMSPRLADKFYMHYQVAHGKPIVEGHVSRPPDAAFAFLESTRFLDHLHSFNKMDPAIGDVTNQLRVLADANVRYLVLHKQLATDEQLDAWQDWLTFAPHHADAELIVYRTKPQYGADFAFAHSLRADFGLIQLAADRNTVTQSDPVYIDAHWGSAAVLPHDFAACVQLRDGTGALAQKTCFGIGGEFPTSNWQANEVVRDRYEFRIDPFLAPGDYVLTLAVRSGDGPMGKPVGKPIAMGAVEIRPLPRNFGAPQPGHPLEVRLGDSVQLLSYDTAQTPEALDLTLYWQAWQRMDASYKVFVHLVNVETGEIATQHDAPPRDWTYPTTWWEKGEVVHETIALSLADAPPGRYRALVGMYDPATATRLAAVGAEGRYADDAVVVTEIEHPVRYDSE